MMRRDVRRRAEWPDEAFILGKMRALLWVLKGLVVATFGLTMWTVFVEQDATLTAVAFLLMVLTWSIAVVAMTVAWLGGEREPNA